MDAERWRRIESLFEHAADLPSGEQEPWLEAACPDDAGIVAEVLAMIRADQPAVRIGDQIEQAAAEFAATPGVPAGRAGPYKLTRQLGRGGMGVVYLGERDDGQYEAQVAVKLVIAGLNTGFFLERFRRERQALARLHHPNIARIFDSGTTPDGLPYIVMELVDGVPITDYVRQRNLAPGEVVALYRQVCRGVAHAHSRNVVHRDLKPGNILVEPDGTPKLLDFGICKIIEESPRESDTVAGMFLLTPDYASPEQIMGEPVTAASDIYSLGAVLYELLTGRPPHVIQGSSPAALVAACEEPVPPPASVAASREAAAILTGPLGDVLLKTLEKNPLHRFESVEALSAALGAALEGSAGTRRNAATRRWLIGAGGVAAAVAVGIGYRETTTEPRVAVESLPEFLEAHRLLKVPAAGESGDDGVRRIQQALALFQRLGGEHPGSAEIQSGLAESYIALTDPLSAERRRYFRLALQAATRGMRENPRIAALHHSAAMSYLFEEWDISRALAAFSRAVELDPSRGNSHRFRSDVLCMLGRFGEASAALNAAQALAPVDIQIGAERAALQIRRRNYIAAAASARQVLTVDRSDGLAQWVLGLALEGQGHFGEAEAILRALPFRPVRGPIALAHLLARTGRREEALAIAEKIRRVAPHPSAEAVIHVALGDHAAALGLLEEAIAAHDMNVLYVTIDARYDPIRGEARFQAFARTLRLPGNPASR